MKLLSESNLIRIFVAATISEYLPFKVLEYSIKENTQNNIDICPIYQFNRVYSLPKDKKNYPRTPFSFQRFLIPEFCHFQGKAIYLDSDMLVFSDLSNLWNTDLINYALQTTPSPENGRKGQFSVMALNCEKLLWKIEEIIEQLDKGDISYTQLMYEMKLAPSIGYDLSTAWNSLEEYNNLTNLLHYTDMNTQPWVSTKNPLGYLWVQCLRRAIADNYISPNEVQQEVSLGHIRPSLIAQLSSSEDDVLCLQKSIKKLDNEFIAPFKNIHCHNAKPWISPLAWYKSKLSKTFKQTLALYK